MNKVNSVIVLVALVFLVLGCEGGPIWIEGRVYSSPEVDETTAILFVNQIDTVLPGSLRPVADCDVLVEPWRLEEREQYQGKGMFAFQTTTVEDGGFKTGGFVSPYRKFEGSISVKCPGRKPIEKNFSSDLKRVDKVIVVVPQASESEAQETESRNRTW